MDKFNFIRISSVDSTNQYTLSLKSSKLFKEGLVVVTKYQYRGKGQRTSTWESERSKNIIFSLVVEPRILLAKQFMISKIICLSVINFLFKLGVEATIKWPNDILIRNRKIAGILIENIVSKGMITHSVIGIGLNVNQLIFDNYVPKATSLSLELEKCFDLEDMQNALLQSIRDKIKSFRSGLDLDLEYLNVLYKKDKVVLFQSEFEIFHGLIRGVNNRGLLIIEANDSIREFDLKEIRMLF